MNEREKALNAQRKIEKCGEHWELPVKGSGKNRHEVKMIRAFQALALRDIDKMTYSQIGTLMRIDRERVRQLMGTARNAFRYNQFS
jgi:predicted DNA-binding protein (UPF0251 family)